MQRALECAYLVRLLSPTLSYVIHAKFIHQLAYMCTRTYAYAHTHTLTHTHTHSHTLHCLQIVREMAPNHYLALLKFKDKPSALDFYTAFNGKKYSSFQDYVCHVVFVTHVDIKHKTGEAALPVAGLTELPNCPVCLERMVSLVGSVGCFSKNGICTCGIF